MISHHVTPKALTRLIETFTVESPLNRFQGGFDERAFDEVLVGFAAGTDPLFDAYKDLVGDFHWTPAEIYNLAYPDTPATPEDLTVISWVLPHRAAVKADNRGQDLYPAARWVQGRFAGEDFNTEIRNRVILYLQDLGIQAVAPAISPLFSWGRMGRYVYASTWSERHAAHAAGLGTFGLCDGLITPKGKAHRLGSVVARITLAATPRPYTHHRAYCLFFYDGSCKACARRCPVGAISEAGHDKEKCWGHAGKTCADYIEQRFGFKGYGCGLCQTAVPCESGIPPKILLARAR